MENSPYLAEAVVEIEDVIRPVVNDKEGQRR